jgi:hypothetical protein
VVVGLAALAEVMLSSQEFADVARVLKGPFLVLPPGGHTVARSDVEEWLSAMGGSAGTAFFPEGPMGVEEDRNGNVAIVLANDARWIRMRPHRDRPPTVTEFYGPAELARRRLREEERRRHRRR